MPRVNDIYSSVRAVTSASVEDRILSLTDAVNELTRRLGMNEERDESARRFVTTGPTALPMTSNQVAVILNTTPAAIRALAMRGLIRSRYAGRCRFHPDDVRAYLNHKAD